VKYPGLIFGCCLGIFLGESKLSEYARFPLRWYSLLECLK